MFLKKIHLILLVTIASVFGLKAQPNRVIDEVIAVVGNTPVLRSELDVSPGSSAFAAQRILRRWAIPIPQCD